MDPATFLLALGAATRLTRLAVVDDITGPIRTATIRTAARAVGPRGASFTQALLSCPFCIGFWLSAATVVSATLWSDHLWWQTATATLTVSWLAGHAVARADMQGDDDG